MKRLFWTFVTVLLIGITCVFMSITVHAEGKYTAYEEEWLRKQQERSRKYLDELEAEGNLTQEAIDATKLKDYDKQPNNKSKSSSSGNGSGSGSSSGSSYSGSGKGWVYSTDELHVVGLPEGENGYTLPGWYGDID